MLQKTHKRRKYRKRRTMKGGTYNEQQFNSLRNNGFTDEQIDTLESMNIPIEEITERINSIMNENQTNVNNDISNTIMNELLDTHNQNLDIMDIESISHADDNNNMDLDLSQGSLHLSDLDEDSRISGYTTDPDESFGGKKNKKSKKNRNNKKSKKNRNNKKSKKNRNNKKQNGGVCYGNGVGANSYDPNFSLYNTRELQLFPYKTN
jgi:hypothetical protein